MDVSPTQLPLHEIRNAILGRHYSVAKLTQHEGRYGIIASVSNRYVCNCVPSEETLEVDH
jgi:hypothetical protein